WLADRAQKPRPGRPEAGFCRWIIRTQLPPPAFVIYPIDGQYAVASRADEYRRRAQQCLEMAGTFKEREARATLSHMAEVWLRLAEATNPARIPAATADSAQERQSRPRRGRVGGDSSLRQIILDRAEQARRAVADDQQRIREAAPSHVLEELAAGRRVLLAPGRQVKLLAPSAVIVVQQLTTIL